MDWDSILEFFSVNQAPIRRYLRALNVDRIWTSSHKSSLYVHSYYGRGGVELEEPPFLLVLLIAFAI